MNTYENTDGTINVTPLHPRDEREIRELVHMICDGLEGSLNLLVSLYASKFAQFPLNERHIAAVRAFLDPLVRAEAREYIAAKYPRN